MEALPLKKFSRKRRFNKISVDPQEIANDDNNMAKRQKVEIAPDPTFDTKVIDINVDCLEAIFRYMTLTDLVNIAEAHENLVEAAGIIFRRLYKWKTFKINVMRYNLGSAYTSHNIKTDCIQIHDRNFGSKIFEHFGEHIKKVSIDFCGLKSNWFAREIQTEVQKFCKSTLIGLEIENCPELLLDQTFSEVRDLTIKNSVLSLKQIRLFPSLSRLSLMGNTVKGGFETISGLEHLAISIDVNPIGFSPADVLTALWLNKKISSLHLAADFNSHFLHTVSKFATNLRSLSLYMLSYDDEQTEEIVHFRGVEKLKITSNREPFANLPLKFDELKEMKLIVNGNAEIGFIEFISQHSQLEQLDIIAPNWNEIKFTDDDMAVISANLSNLNRLVLNNVFVSVDAAAGLMQKCQSLKKFVFTCHGVDDVVETNRTWDVTKTGQHYVCTRK